MTVIYCDENCHLQNDGEKSMVLGALSCEGSKKHEATERVKSIIRKHLGTRSFEVKWTKVSSGEIELYKELVSFFFASDYLRFRAVVVPDKTLLKHEEYGQTHDHWYYKMYYLLLRDLVIGNVHSQIYMDIKDSYSTRRAQELLTYLRTKSDSLNPDSVCKIQIIRSEEVLLAQLSDLLIGAVSYKTRELNGSTAKLGLVKQIEDLSNVDILVGTSSTEEKFNVFRWRAR